MPNGQQYCPYYPDPDGERGRGRGREREREHERERERERERFETHFAGFFPPIVTEFFPHVSAAVDEMDDLRFPLLPRERFDAMTDRIMSRLEGAQMLQFPGFEFDRRRELARALVASLLIAELLRRRRRFFI